MQASRRPPLKSVLIISVMSCIIIGIVIGCLALAGLFDNYDTDIRLRTELTLNQSDLQSHLTQNFDQNLQHVSQPPNVSSNSDNGQSSNSTQSPKNGRKHPNLQLQIQDEEEPSDMDIDNTHKDSFNSSPGFKPTSFPETPVTTPVSPSRKGQKSRLRTFSTASVTPVTSPNTTDATQLRSDSVPKFTPTNFPNSPTTPVSPSRNRQQGKVNRNFNKAVDDFIPSDPCTMDAREAGSNSVPSSPRVTRTECFTNVLNQSLRSRSVSPVRKFQPRKKFQHLDLSTVPLVTPRKVEETGRPNPSSVVHPIRKDQKADVPHPTSPDVSTQ